MPIFPVMDSVPYAQLRLYLLGLHLHVKLEGKRDKEVIVAAVYEPLDRPEFLQGRFVRLVDEVYG